MKKLIMPLLATVLLSSCYNKDSFKKHRIKINDIVYNTYAYDIERVTILDTNSNGVFVKRYWKKDLDFITYQKLFEDPAFKVVGHAYPKSNPLMGLKKMDNFKMIYGTQVVSFIVKEVTSNGIICTSTDWLWNSELLVKYTDYDSSYYRYIGVYKGLTK